MILNDLPPRTIECLKKFSELFFEKNKELNLSSVRSREGIWLKHVYDSLLILKTGIDFSKYSSVLDIGTGGGLPGIPLAIVWPEKKVMLIDATEKKIRAVNGFIRQLDLKNAQTIAGRAEELGHHGKFRGLFDLVVARAIAGLNVLAEYALPFAKQGGYFVAYKGKDPDREVQRALPAIRKLGGAISDIVSLNVPELGERSFIIIKKEHSTPEIYPRTAARIKREPL